MEKKINQIKEKFLKEKEKFLNEKEKLLNETNLNNLKITFLGKKGVIADLYKQLKSVSAEEKKLFGKLINELKNDIDTFIKAQQKILITEKINQKLKSEWLDITMPYNKKSNFKGHMSLIYKTAYEIVDIFHKLGFSVFDGPQAEDEYHNFTALNIPETHPARDMQDTIWLKNNMLLRTHTSAVQIRAMEKFTPPLKGISPGRVFRYEAIDASHENTFYQVEGIMIDKDISVAHLIYFMKTLLSEIFKKDINIRLRPGFFPFVEPGFELDIQCLICGGKGCPVCKNVGWVELLPCGLIHPNVLKQSGIDPDKWSGFAFGLGLNRLAMMKYEINDIRWFESGDLRFNTQF